MRADQMELGKLYKHQKRVIQLAFPVQSDLVIVHQPGELDMQSKFGIALGSPVKEVPRIAEKDECPSCLNEIDKVINKDNPECRKWSHYCGGCGWMGNLK